MTVSHLTRSRGQLWSDLVGELGGSGSNLTLSEEELIAAAVNTYGGSVSAKTTSRADLIASLVNAAGGSVSSATHSEGQMMAALANALGGSVSALTGSFNSSLAASVNAAASEGGGGEFEGPLDVQAGALVAFSISRALSAEMIGENIITLRRDSDDATMDFVAGEDGEVDEAAITTWLAGANGFIAKLWDQSGNDNHALSVDDATQIPWVANAVNGHAAGQGTDGAQPKEVRCGEIVYADGGFVGFMVARRDVAFYALNTSPDDMEFRASATAGNDPIYMQQDGSNDAGMGVDATGLSTSAYLLWDVQAVYDNCDVFVNGTDRGANEFVDGDPLTSITIDPTRWNISGFNSGQTNGAAEVIVYPPSVAGAARTEVRANIADYYGITLA